jgi:hypothetical protein
MKVFQAQFGFFDTVVAVPSQAAALRVWGTRQNLFASGQARLATDQAAITAALQSPKIVLRRAVGSTDAFAREPERLPNIPAAPASKTRKTKAAPPDPPVDRAKLNAAESALKKVDSRRIAEEAEFRRAADALEAQRTAAQDAYVHAKEKAAAEIAAEEKAFRKSGGRA